MDLSFISNEVKTRSWALIFVKNITKVVFSTVLLSISLGFLEESSLYFEGIDKFSTFSMGSALTVLGVIFYQNMVYWHNYGIFKHNQYYNLRTGEMNTKAVGKTVISAGFYCACLAIIFQNLDVINWLIIFTSVPPIILILRHIIYE